MKNFSRFAAFKTKNKRHNSSVDGIFYARLNACICKDKEAVQIPAAVIELCQCSWSNLGGEQPFLYYLLNFSLAMTKNNENASTTQGVCTSTSDYESVISTLKREFKIEMDAKNRAYAFILHNGLFDEYSKFCKAINGYDPHKLCFSILSEQV